jgi:hypothetical protein
LSGASIEELHQRSVLSGQLDLAVEVIDLGEDELLALG